MLTFHLAKLSSPRPPHASAEKEKEKEKDKGTGWFQRILQTYAPLSFDFNLRTQPRYLLFLLFLFIKYIFGYRFYLIKLFVRLFLSGVFFLLSVYYLFLWLTIFCFISRVQPDKECECGCDFCEGIVCKQDNESNSSGTHNNGHNGHNCNNGHPHGSTTPANS